MIIESFRPFLRYDNKIQLKLRMEDWPTDVPLPPNTEMTGIGENHEIKIPPHWNLILKPDCTVEYFGGWFRFDLKIEEAYQWFLTELPKRGWTAQEPKPELNPDVHRHFDFDYPKHNARLEIGLQWWESLNETTALITRITTHPWQPIVIDLGDDDVSEDQIPLPLMEEAVT